MSVFIHLNALSHKGIVIEVLKEYKKEAYYMITLFLSRYEHTYEGNFEDVNEINIGLVEIPDHDIFQICLSNELPDSRIFNYIQYRFFQNNNTNTQDWFNRFSFFLEDWFNLRNNNYINNNISILN